VTGRKIRRKAGRKRKYIELAISHNARRR